MTGPKSIPEQVHDAVMRGAIIVTSNQRAARTLRRLEERSHLTSGEGGWIPPQIDVWAGWIASQWRNLLISGVEDRILLTRPQELRLWERILAGSKDNTSLIAPRSIAEMAIDAANLASSWNMQAELISSRSGASNDAATFQRWLASFDRLCVKERCLPIARAAQAIAQALQNDKTAPAMQEIVLVGFDRLLPAQEFLLQAFKDRGVSVTQVEPPSLDGPVFLATCMDETDELRQCALWLKQNLDEGAGLLAVIVPDLEACRDEIERIFRAEIASWSFAENPFAAVFEFSLGHKLSVLPLTRDALELLRWAFAPIDLETASQLLRSPFLGSEGDICARAEFDASILRRTPRLSPLINLLEMVTLLQKHSGREGAPHLSLTRLAEGLRALHHSARTHSVKTRSWTQWSDIARELLQAAGWPGPRALDSREFQLRERWERLLDELAALDVLGERVPASVMLETLQAMAAEALFAPESSNAPIQIMGLMEAAGSTFDALWFLHADDLRWPLRTSPNALLPWQLQRESGMPGAYASADFAVATEITRRIMRSSAHVVFSYAERRAEGEMRLSPVVQALSSLNKLPRIEAESAVRPTVVMEEIEDFTPVPLLHKGILSGGANILELQAACGFRAFAEKRLFSTTPGETAAGMNAIERGEAVHIALELFWTEVKDQETLWNLSATQEGEGTARDLILKKCIDQALLMATPTPWEIAYLEVERNRLHALLSAWLDVEAVRPYPFRVVAMERKLSAAQIGDLQLGLRVDRIDSVATEAGESLVLIDYKTGSANPAQWQGERPDRPQLPLYAVAGNLENVSGIAFASVRAGDDTLWLRGVSREPDLFRVSSRKTNEMDFDAQMEQWNASLYALAEEFVGGYASVDPKHPISTCIHCGQRILCRVNSFTPGTSGDEIDDTPEDLEV